MRALGGLMLAIALLAMIPGSALAEIQEPGRTTTVGPIASGPTVSSGSAGFNPSGTQAQAESRTDQGVTGTTPQLPGASGSSLSYTPIQNGVIPGGGSAALLVACPPGTAPYAVFDAAGTLVNTVCVSNQNPVAGPLSTPLLLAQQASAQQPWPSLQVGINPSTGLTGLASWFWLSGNPQMPDATASAGPLTVTVHAALIDVDWDFGDGSGMSSGTDLGRAFPAQSSIQHMFQTSTFARPGGYSCVARVLYRVTFSVDGGPLQIWASRPRPSSPLIR